MRDRYGTSATPASVASSFVTVITTNGAAAWKLVGTLTGAKASLEETAVPLPRKSARMSAENFTALSADFFK